MNSEEPTEEQRDEAALWLARRTGGSFGPEDHAKLEAWLNADRRHRRAFDEIRVLYAQLEAPAQRVAATTSLSRRLGSRFHPRLSWLVPPAACLAAVCLVWWMDPSVVQDWRADIVTGQDVVSTFTLPDGSLARLGADTALSLDFDAGRRRVSLLHGEAYFEVQHGVTGTFTVVANGDEVRDIGTKFNVDLDPNQTEVTVAQGSVEVFGSTETSPVLLHADNQVAIAGGRAGGIRIVDSGLALSWLNGRLVVQGARVEDVVHALQRHTSRKIVIRGGLGGRRLSGTFPLTNVDASLDTIASAVGGSIAHVTPLITVLY